MVSMKTGVTTLILVLCVLLVADAAPWVERELIVKFKTGTNQATIDRITKQFGTETLYRFRLIQARHLRIRGNQSVRSMVAKFRRHPAVEYAEPNYIVRAAVMPNDTNFNDLWGLHNTGQTGGTSDADIDAPEAWNTTTGSDQVIVGIVDSGIDYNHSDLKPNIWTNPDEIPGNGVDDDNNGYIDDIHGWDFANNDNDPMDDNSHGTHVAGTIGAVGNNSLGVVGINWNVRLMALKFLDANGSGAIVGAVKAIEYATIMGAHLTNNSWVGSQPSLSLRNAVAAGPLCVAAAGNSGVRRPYWPAAYSLDNVISVAATDYNDDLAGFSNYGSRWVDLAAPGVGIISTIPGDSYASFSGTSMAAPHVSGVAALLYGANSVLSATDIKQAILNSVDPKPSLTGKMVTGGRLNAAVAVTAVLPAAPQLPGLDRSAFVSDTAVVGRTALGPAFPSPANPEVWIPYRLDSTSEVTISIYDAMGHPVRTLNLGRQPAGIYDSRSTAAHWDGYNSRGETVASGFYFYTLDAGNFLATRRLLIIR